MKDLTLITCSYNTPQITLTMLKSWMFWHNHVQNLILVDNSTDTLTQDLLLANNVPYKSTKGGTHGEGVNEALSLCNTKYALLVDTDVIFLKNHSNIFEQFKKLDLTIMGKIEGSRGGKNIYNRVNPWHCFINVNNIKANNITFFNKEKMKNSFCTDKIYDIGSTFFEDVNKLKLKIGDVDLSSNYFFHLEGMSWYKNKYNPNEKDTGIDFGGTHNNINYVKAHELKMNSFELQFENKFKNVDIFNKFIYE